MYDTDRQTLIITTVLALVSFALWLINRGHIIGITGNIISITTGAMAYLFRNEERKKGNVHIIVNIAGYLGLLSAILSLIWIVL